MYSAENSHCFVTGSVCVHHYLGKIVEIPNYLKHCNSKCYIAINTDLYSICTQKLFVPLDSIIMVIGLTMEYQDGLSRAHPSLDQILILKILHY